MDNKTRLGIIILATAIAIFAVATAVASLPALQQSNEESTPEPAAEQDREIESSQDYIRSLKAKEAELNRREKELLKREQQIIIQEKDLAERISAFDVEKTEFEEMKKQWQEDQQVIQNAAESERIKDIAAGFKSVKSSTAANQLTALFETNPTTALLILNQLDSRTFGKLFDKIGNPQKAAEIIEALKNWNISVDEASKITDTEVVQ